MFPFLTLIFLRSYDKGIVEMAQILAMNNIHCKTKTLDIPLRLDFENYDSK
jgi:hypothetical protein